MCDTRTEIRKARLQLRSEQFKCAGQFLFFLTGFMAFLTALLSVIFRYTF